tara:strand:- start:454 stop:627 length:174 start_codon:yes stop_codon:yes gene_type:complete
MENDTRECVICHHSFQGRGHNPFPVKEEGECCGGCNNTIVIPHRIALYTEIGGSLRF